MHRVLCFLLFLLVATHFPQARADEPVRVHFINSGYGDAVLIQLPAQKNILFDGGTGAYGKHLSEYLASAGVTRLDAVIISHPHKNHFQGLFEVFKKIVPERVYQNGDPNPDKPYAKLLEILASKNVSVSNLQAGDTFEVGGVNFEVLHPDGEFGHDLNNNSLVLRMTHGKTSFLFPADIRTNVQESLVRKYGDKMKADCLMIPHHGDDLDPAFAEKNKDSIWILSTGRNIYGLPRKASLKTPAKALLRTDQEGDIVVESDGERLRVIKPLLKP